MLQKLQLLVINKENYYAFFNHNGHKGCTMITMKGIVNLVKNHCALCGKNLIINIVN